MLTSFGVVDLETLLVSVGAIKGNDARFRRTTGTTDRDDDTKIENDEDGDDWD